MGKFKDVEYLYYSPEMNEIFIIPFKLADGRNLIIPQFKTKENNYRDGVFYYIGEI